MGKRIAFDVHGVLDTYPEICMGIVKLLKNMDCTICCVSGPEKLQIQKELTELAEKGFDEKILFENQYSVVDSLKHWGVKFEYDADNNPWCDEETWWDSKARICKQHNIDILIDDSWKYEAAFKLTDSKFIHISEFVREVKK